MTAYESLARTAAWAQLHLIRGDGPSALSFRAGEPARLCVGSDPCADLTIAAKGVAPSQFELVWDGTHLWLEDRLRLGCTRVNGRTLNEWHCVQGRALVSFGAAWLMLRSHGPAATRTAPDFDALDRVRPSQLGLARRRDTVRTVMS